MLRDLFLPNITHHYAGAAESVVNEEENGNEDEDEDADPTQPEQL